MLQTLPYFAISTHVLFSISISIGFIKISPDTINSTLTLLEIPLPTVPFVEQAPINVQFVCCSSGFFFRLTTKLSTLDPFLPLRKYLSVN